MAALFAGMLTRMGDEIRVVSCEYDLPTLFSRLKKNGYDLFRSLPLEENGIMIPEGARIDTLFSQIFLFFDYDFQNRIGVDRVNDILEEMLDYFDDETENGKLYVNYPMIESLKHTKEMPDEKYYRYMVSRSVCAKHKFKGIAEAEEVAEQFLQELKTAFTKQIGDRAEENL